MAETKKELFISYGREPETVNFVRLLKRDLEKNGLTVWLDAEDISAGCDWYSAIGQGLENCQGIIAVITNKYINSHYCKSELYTANNDKKHIFPIIFEDVDFSSSATAKGVKYIISGINWTMFRPSVDDYHTSLARLCQGMKEQGLGVEVGEGVAAQTATSTTDALATQMGHLNVSGSSDPPPSAPPPYSYHTPPHPSPHGHSGGYPQSPYPPPAPYPSSHAPYPPGPHPPYQTTPPHPGYPQQPSVYGYSQQPPPPPISNSNCYPPALGYTVPPSTQYPGVYAPPTTTPPAPPTQHPGMYTPPNATSSAPPTQHPGMYTPPNATSPAPPPPPVSATYYTEHTDQGPPNYFDLYKGHPPPRPPPTAPSAAPLPEKPSSTAVSDSVSPSKSKFSVGMKLEAVDRRFPYFVCVATIMDRTDSEVLIHFDGWSSDYDYWCPPDVVELHPPGWCHRNNWELQTPREQEWYGWDEYVSRTDADKAPEHLFTQGQLAGPGTLLFRAGMSVEAKDRQNPSLMCAATIQRIDERGRLLIHFDGWGQSYDYWCEPSTTDIHPPMWCGKNSRKVQPPHGYQGHFKWSEYLATPGRIPAPAHLFMEEQLSANGRPRSAGQRSSGGTQQLGTFQVGMKLEAKDRLYPTLTAVATIIDIRDNMLLIHFDGWTSKYDYWCKPTSTDIHPMGWCARHNRELQPPKDMSGAFSWTTYLQQRGAKAVPSNAFTHSQQ